VREVLGLEGVRSTLAVSVAADAHQRPGQEVAGVELNAGLVRPYGELTAAGRVEGLGGEVEPERTVVAGVQHPVVVVALRFQELVEARGIVRRADVCYPGTHLERAGEVERRAEHRRIEAERDRGGVRRRVLVRVDLDELAVSR